MLGSLFVLLYVAHLVGDYPLQSDHQAAHKAATGSVGWRAAAAHASVHVAVSALALTAGALVIGLHLSVWQAAAALAWIGSTHALIDRRWPVLRWMHAARQTAFAAHGGAAHVDQTAHLVALLVAALVLSA